MNNHQPHYQTPGQMYERLCEVIRARRRTGLRSAAGEAFLEPENPFERRGFRRPKPAVATVLAVVLAFAAVFLWFSFAR